MNTKYDATVNYKFTFTKNNKNQELNCIQNYKKGIPNNLQKQLGSNIINYIYCVY